MSNKLIKIDELTRCDHSFLSEEDSCHHVMVYHPRKGYAFGHENDLLQNFKKPMNRQGLPEWKYKARAVIEISGILRNIISKEDLHGITIVPIPPSRVKTDPGYDNRLERVLNRFTKDYDADIRELLYLKENYNPSHGAVDGERLRPEDFEKLYKIDNTLCKPKPKKIVLFDDIITAGSHYVGCRNLLAKKFPEARIIGVFIFRRVPEATENI